MKALRKIQFGLESAGALAGPLSRFQDGVEEVLLDIQKTPTLDGHLLTGITLLTGIANEIAHRLGRRPRGWYIVRKRADSSIWDAQDANLLPDRTLTLYASAEVTVDIWVF